MNPPPPHINHALLEKNQANAQNILDLPHNVSDPGTQSKLHVVSSHPLEHLIDGYTTYRAHYSPTSPFDPARMVEPGF